MYNSNFNHAGTGSGSDHPRSLSMSSSSRSRSRFGFHEFSNNEAAHSFVNTALNSGNGYHGGITAAFQLNDPSASRSPRFNGTRLNGSPRPLYAPVPSPLQQFFGAMNPIGLHPHPMQNQVPPPSDSVMILLASVDEPSASSGQSLQSQQRNGGRFIGGLDGNMIQNSDPSLSPFPSNVSEASSHSHSSLSSHHSSASSENPGSRCRCDFCSRCVCHNYCGHHAEIRCPVHGLGRGSSAESNASSSPVSHLSGDGSSGSPFPRFPSNVSESSSSHSRDSWASFDSEFGESPVHSDSCQCVTCQFCICNRGGMFTNCIARCAKHGMVRLY